MHTAVRVTKYEIDCFQRDVFVRLVSLSFHPKNLFASERDRCHDALAYHSVEASGLRKKTTLRIFGF